MLSVIVITKNEEANLRRCLESVSFADEIIVLDSGSTDNTMMIAKEFTDKVFVSEDWLGYGIQKQRVLECANGDWVLNLDADESVDENLKKDILGALRSHTFDAYQVPICMMFYGKAVPHSCSPTRHVRLFKREGAAFSDDIVHEKIVLPKSARIGKLSSAIMHHSFRDVRHALYKMNRYSSYSAQIRRQNSQAPNALRILFSAGWMFFRCFVLQRGFLDGREGFLLAVLSAEGSFYRGVKQIFPDNEI